MYTHTHTHTHRDLGHRFEVHLDDGGGVLLPFIREPHERLPPPYNHRHRAVLSASPKRQYSSTVFPQVLNSSTLFPRAVSGARAGERGGREGGRKGGGSAVSKRQYSSTVFPQVTTVSPYGISQKPVNGHLIEQTYILTYLH